MPQAITWAKTPARVEATALQTVVYFALLNGRSRGDGLSRPHTFVLPAAGVTVANRVPVDVVWDNPTRRWLGSWNGSAQRWKTEPLMVVRRDFDSLAVTFETDEAGAGAVRLPEALRTAPHTFAVAAEGGTAVRVDARPPDRVVTVRRGDVRCPCYGIWYVPAPLAQAQWSSVPVSLPSRPWGDRNTVVVEYVFFTPAASGGGNDWGAVAARTPHSFALAGRRIIDQKPDSVTQQRGGIVGQWRIRDPFVEGFSPEPCAGGVGADAALVVLLAVLLTAIMTYCCCRAHWSS